MITFCIPSKNNLRYLKSCIKSIRDNSTYDNKIIVYVDSDNDGTKKWLEENNVNYIQNDFSYPKGIAYGYNRCIEAADTELVCMFHADMYMAKGFDVNIVKHIKDKKVVVSATRIEPPLHPEGLEKIVKNFGMYPEDFKKHEFDSFCETQSIQNKDTVTYGIFAPWVMYKSELIEIGMHDEYFHSYQEDSDIFNRLVLNGVKCIQSRDSFVYHLTCRGGQFQDGVENITTDKEFHRMKNSAARNYIRKWGSWVKNDEYQHPIIYPKYDIGFVIRNCSIEALNFLECWGVDIYCDLAKDKIEEYILFESKNTQFNLQNKIKNIIDDKKNDIIIDFDATKISAYSSKLLQEIPLIIKENNSVGKFELDIFVITINNMTEYQTKLVDNKSEYYNSKLNR